MVLGFSRTAELVGSCLDHYHKIRPGGELREVKWLHIVPYDVGQLFRYFLLPPQGFHVVISLFSSLTAQNHQEPQKLQAGPSLTRAVHLCEMQGGERSV